MLHIFAVYNQNLNYMEEEYKYLLLTDEYIDISDMDEEDADENVYFLIDRLIKREVKSISEYAIRKLSKRYSKEEILRAVPKFVNRLKAIGLIVDYPVGTGLYIRVDKYMNWIWRDFSLMHDDEEILGYYTPGIDDDKRSIIFD